VLRACAGDFHDADLGFAVMVVGQFHIRFIRLFGYLNPNQAFEHHRTSKPASPQPLEAIQLGRVERV
jgi:hypothetical protein